MTTEKGKEVIEKLRGKEVIEKLRGKEVIEKLRGTEEQAVYHCDCRGYHKGYYSNIKLMQSYFATEGWHKVKAVLKVDSNIELGGDKVGTR